MNAMSGADMGSTNGLVSFGLFIVSWIAMMAAMMLPGAIPAVAKCARADGLRAVPRFVASYLAAWTLVGVVAYPLRGWHGSLGAGIAVVAAGLYEASPLKAHFRRRCRDHVRSGFEFGYFCLGSTIGLTTIQIGTGLMNPLGMVAIAAIAAAQKVLPERRAIDVPLALVIVSIGIVMLVAPSSLRGL